MLKYMKRFNFLPFLFFNHPHTSIQTFSTNFYNETYKLRVLIIFQYIITHFILKHQLIHK